MRPSATEGSIVSIVVGWELSWYRYEVDLADEEAGVRLVAQGAELTELEVEDQAPNAVADAARDARARGVIYRNLAGWTMPAEPLVPARVRASAKRPLAAAAVPPEVLAYP